MEDLTFYGYSGEVTFIDYRKFIDKIPRQVTDQEYVPYATAQSLKGYDSPPGMLEVSSNIDAKREVVTMKEERIILDPDEVRDNYKQVFPVFLDSSLNPVRDGLGQQALSKFMSKRLIHLMMQKNIDTHFPTLNTDTLENMSRLYAENFGTDGYAVTFHLNKYQKFLAVCSAQAFRMFHSNFYLNERIDLNRQYEIVFRGELIVQHPDKWILAQYKEDNLRHEIEASRRFR